MDDLKEHLEIKKQQKATVDFQMNLFNNQLANAIAKKAVEDFVYEGQGLQSVANHYEDEIKELEAKKRILEEFSRPFPREFTYFPKCYERCKST